MKKSFAAVSLLFSAVLSAAMPADSKVIEAETMTCANNAWGIRQHYTGYYSGHPSGGAHLEGANQIQGTAAARVTIDKPGRYNLWVRYLDMNANRANAGFTLTVRRGETAVAAGEFDRDSMRADAEGIQKWGSGYAVFVWDKLPFEISDAGEYVIEVAKLKKGVVPTAAGRHLDLFLITGDLQFEPRITDLYPVFFRIKMLDGQDAPAAMHIFGMRSEATGGWYIPHGNINRKGWFTGPDNGAGNMKSEHLKAGDETGWFELSRHLSYKGFDRIQFSTMTSYHEEHPKSAAFEISFSRDASGERPWKTFRRTGSGNSLQIAVNLVTDEITSEIEASRISAGYAMAAGDVPGKAPEKFPFSTGLALERGANTDIAVTNELNALRAIGINATGSPFAKEDFPIFRAARYCFHLVKNGCLNQPDAARIDDYYKRFASAIKSGGAPQPFVLNVMDEPNLRKDHIRGCDYCKTQFAEYLARNGIAVAPATFTDDPADGARYYWSMRYANTIITDMLRTASAAVAEHLPGVPATANFDTTLVYDGNMLSGSCDWFDILGSGALTFGWGEDWANHSRTYQCNGYYMDVMRAACRKKDIPFGMYDIIDGRSGWEITAKGFMIIGHGAKAVGFHNYGPWYLMSSDANSQHEHIYRAIKDVTFPTGQVEDILTAARPARGDAAQLYSTVCDIWNKGKDNVFGRERVYLNLLMRHCDYALDTIDEDSLAGELKNYRLLLVSDSHIRRDSVPLIVRWVKDGGTLLLTAGALQFDESNAPLGLREELGVPNNAVAITQYPGTAQHHMPRLRSIAVHQGMELLSGIQEPLHQAVKAEKGQVIAAGFFPGISYIGRAKPVSGMPYSILDLPESHRKYISSLPLPVKPRLTSGNHRVEANLLEEKNADVIVLSNWTGQEVETTVKIPGDYRKFTAVNCTLTGEKKSGGENFLTVKVPAGAYLLCEK